MVRKAKQQRDASRSFRVIAIEFRRGFRIVFALLVEQARKFRLRQGSGYRGGRLPSLHRQSPCLLELPNHFVGSGFRDCVRARRHCFLLVALSRGIGIVRTHQSLAPRFPQLDHRSPRSFAALPRGIGPTLTGASFAPLSPR